MRHSDPSQILHVVEIDKFIPPFIDFLEQRFADFGRHVFFIFGDRSRYPIRKRPNTVFASDFDRYVVHLAFARRMNCAHKIILHGLFRTRILRMLAVQPWLLNRSYWVIWGGDLYRRELAVRNRNWYLQEVLRRFIIRRLGNLVTYVDGDVALARRWYGARGRYRECLMYPSNVFEGISVPPKEDDTVRIQVGNSADPSNEHFEALEKLERYRDQDIRIYVPLSYGDPAYATRVAKAGARIFGEKFTALTEFMPFDEYRKFLGGIDVAVFNHRRQQGMGNIITLLGLGKKVYLRRDVTSWPVFERMGLKVFDSEKVDLGAMDDASGRRNEEIVRSNFSADRLARQLERLFEE